jgi:spore maturation protein CgeB
MRLFEVTGVGSLLLTDAKTNLGELFEAGEEVVTWNDTAHCVEQVSRYLADDSARRQIAAAGQRRTLRDHTYRRRMEQYHGVVSELMRERRR